MSGWESGIDKLCGKGRFLLFKFIIMYSVLLLAALLSVGRAGCLDQSRSSIQPDQQIASARGFVERGIVYYLRRF